MNERQRKKSPKKRQRIPKITMKTNMDGSPFASADDNLWLRRELAKVKNILRESDKLVGDCLFELQLCVTALDDAGAKNRYYKLERRLQVLRGQLEMFP